VTIFGLILTPLFYYALAKRGEGNSLETSTVKNVELRPD